MKKITILANLKHGLKISDLWNNLGQLEALGIEVVDIFESK